MCVSVDVREGSIEPGVMWVGGRLRHKGSNNKSGSERGFLKGKNGSSSRRSLINNRCFTAFPGIEVVYFGLTQCHVVKHILSKILLSFNPYANA